MFDHSFNYESRRSAVYARNGVVAASHPLAAQIGLEVLRRGGNAADAAVATAAALAVVEPTGTGVGGDCFTLFYDAATKRVSGLNGSGRAAAALNLEVLAAEGFGDGLPRHHVHNVTVPGAVAGWADTLARFGTMGLADVLPGAIALAEDGAAMAPVIARLWDAESEKIRNASPNAAELLIYGRAPRVGEIWRNPGLASVLREIAEGGPAAFYEGRAGAEIVRVTSELGGHLALADLAAHRSTFDDPISTTYRGHTVFECAPNGQGIAALIALNVIEGFDFAELPRRSPERFHTLIEAVRLGFADARGHVADPAIEDVPVERLLSAAHASELRARIDPAARLDLARGVDLAVGSDTVYFSVVDGDGNACSFINSNYNGVGTGIVPRGCGFPLQNRGAGFSLDPTHPNALAPGKRPYHTIIPSMITDANDDLFACYGVMGGWMQPQGHVQVAVGLIDDGLDPQAALDEPRFCIYSDPPHGVVSLEEGLPDATVAALAALGHEVERVDGLSRTSVFGKGQVIMRDPSTGVLIAGSDPRADGQAAAF
ncbi:MAG: gamma-glutamyltransferase family protein [Chloroflexi bacterium]|nr:gamma-glutamyltransferase family protein [Chloroflexota bacterium]MDA1146210.1 gamma-glutamyltransferase family protein [Chloroflexota bacterium]